MNRYNGIVQRDDKFSFESYQNEEAQLEWNQASSEEVITITPVSHWIQQLFPIYNRNNILLIILMISTIIGSLFIFATTDNQSFYHINHDINFGVTTQNTTMLNATVISDVLAGIRNSKVHSSTSIPSIGDVSTPSTFINPDDTTTKLNNAINNPKYFDLSQPLNISIIGDYGDVKSSVLSYPFLENSLIIEPYKISKFIVLNGYDRCNYTWTIEKLSRIFSTPSPVSSGTSKIYYGMFFMAVIEGTGKYSLNVVESCDSGSESEVVLGDSSHSPSLTSSSSSSSSSSLSISLSSSSSQLSSSTTSSSTTSTATTSTTTTTTLPPSQSISRVLTTTLWSKYIRRELLTLTETDREDFLDALYTLYKVNTKDGIKKYGSNYKSMYYFVSLHIDAAGNPVCDEFHKGAGFFSNHLYFSNYLEQSLQLINKKVCLHYMEYATYYSSNDYKKGHLFNQLDGGNWTQLLTSLWFGQNNPITGEIINGRWSYENIEIPFTTTNFYENHGILMNETFFPDEENQWLQWSSAHLRSPYGLLRPPWSFNPSRGKKNWYLNNVNVCVCECALYLCVCV